MTGNTVEYRATLDSSGVKSGAAESAAAIASITSQPVADSLKAVTAEAKRMGSTVQAASGQASDGLAKVSKASQEAGAGQNRANQAAEQFLATLREQISVSSKSADELLRYRASQMGVAAEAAPLILQWQNQKAAQLAAAEAARHEEAAQREAMAAKQRSVTAQDGFLAGLREQIAVSGKSAEELLHYRAAQMGVTAEAAPLILQWQNQKAAQLAAAEAARQEEVAQREAMVTKQRSAAAQESFLAGLRDQVAVQGKSSTEVLQYRAAQLGVSESAAQYIKALDDANNANKRGTISAGQHAAAMRMLPAQMTDVVTSVASGMPIWMVAIQQGGQIKDSFGGVGNAARAMLSTITPVAAAIGVLAGAGGLAAAAYYQGSAEASGFTRALAMSGNAAATNVTEMTAMARAAGDVIGSQHAAAEALTTMAGSGAVAAENLQQFTVVASDLERYVGQSVKTTVEHLAKLGDAPAKASIQLNEQYNYLTESVYRQIQALENQDEKEEAAALAQRTYASAMAERAAQVKGQLGTLERGWNALGLAARGAWDAMLNVGRAATLDDIRTKIDTTNRELNDLLSGDGFASNGGGAAFGAGARGRAARINQLRSQLGELQAQAAPLEAADAQAQMQAEQQAAEASKLAARQRTDALRKETRSRADIRREEIAQLDRDRETLSMGQKEYDKLLGAINEKYKDPKGSTASIKQEQNAYEQLMATIRAKVETDRLELAGTSSLTESQRLRIKLDADLKEGKLQLTEAHEKSVRASLDEMAAGEQALKRKEAERRVDAERLEIAQELADAALAESLAREAGSLAVTRYVASVEESNEALRYEMSLMGRSTRDRETALAQYRIELQLKREIEAVNRNAGYDESQRQAERARLTQAALAAVGAAATQVQLQEWQGAVQQYDQVFRQGFADMLNRGEDGWESFSKSLVTTFKTTVADEIYKTFAQPFVVQLVGQMVGLTGLSAASSAAQAASSGSSILGTVSNAASLAGLISNGVTGTLANVAASAGSLFGSSAMTSFAAGMKGASLASGLAGPTTVGATGAMGAGASTASAISSASSALATAMPYVAAAAVVANALGLFRKTKQVDEGIVGTLGAGDLSTYATMRKSGTLFSGPKYWDENRGTIAESAAVQEAFSVLRTGTADMAKILGLSSTAVTNYTRQIRFATQGLTGDQVAAKLQEEMEEASDAMAELALGTSQYTRLGETATATLQRMSSSLGVANANLDVMGGKMFSVGLSGADMASKLVERFGSIDTYISVSDAYYRAYYSQAERANNSTAAMTKQLGELGLTLPTSRDGFRQLVSSLDLTTDSGRQAYATLLAMAPQFDETLGMLEELANSAAAGLISTYTRAAAVAPGMQIARDAMSSATSQAQTLGGSVSSINKILGDANSGVLTFGGSTASSTTQLNAAHQAVLGLRDEMADLQAAASGTVLNIDGLAKALQGVDARTFTATITSAFELIAERVRDNLSSIANERVAVREAAISILGPTVMTPAQIRAQITKQSVSLPGQGGIAASQAALAKADANIKVKESALASARAASSNTGQTALNNAAKLEAARGDAARALVATYLRHGNIQSGLQGEYVPGSLQGLATYEDTQANMLARMKSLPTADIQAFADQLARLGTSGLREGLGSTKTYLSAITSYQQSVANDAANQAKAASLRSQAATLANKATAAEQALTAARAAQTAAANNAQKAQVDYVGALQKYSLDSGKAVSNLSKLREETVAWYQSQAQLAQTMSASASGLRQTVADIRFSQLDTTAQFANLQERYNVAYSMAMATTGETLAGYGSEMNSLLNPLLQKAQESGLSGAAYGSLVNTLLARAEAIAGRIEKDAPKNYQEESLGLLGQIDSTLAALEAGAKSSDQVLTEAIKAGTDVNRDGLRAVIAALQGRPVPAFALGGMHSGGLRLVGERGPELEVTGPARYFSADQTQRMLSSSAPASGFDLDPLLRELRELRAEVAQLRAERRADGGAIATNTGRTGRLLDRLAEDGIKVRNADGEILVVSQEGA